MAKILVIDDDAQLREMVCRVLRNANHDPIEAPKGKLGMELLRRESPALIMPVQEGIETIAAIREASGLPIIAISGSPDIGDFSPVMDAKLLGADVTLRKPFTAEKLLLAVQQCSRPTEAVEVSIRHNPSTMVTSR